MNSLIIRILLACSCLSFAIIFCACAQTSRTSVAATRLVGTCEGCEAIFEYGDRPLYPVDTLPDFFEAGERMRISGTIYQADGKTPASGVILYVYHTNQEGLYENRYGEDNWARRHGYIRGWMRTAEDGRYTFYTLRPGTYPSRSEPAHIHPTILEPNGKYYWLGSYFFADDPLLTEKERTVDKPRGGSEGVIHLEQIDGLWVGQRDFVLGRHIPDYER